MGNEEFRADLEQIKKLVEKCLSELGAQHSSKLKQSKSRRSLLRTTHALNLDFSMPLRAFMKQNVKGMSGPQKFTLLLAYLAKGDVNKIVQSSEIEKYWATSLLGGEFNRAYSIRAKDEDWVDTKKRGEYNLRPSWRGIFK